MPLTTAPLVNVSRSPSSRRRGGSNPAPIVPGVDSTPNAFVFTDVTGAAFNTLYESNTITVTGIDAPSSLTITGGQYSLNGGAYASAPATVYSGDTVKVRATSSSSGSTAVNVTLTIGGVSDTYTVTTGVAADTTPDAFVFTDVTGATLSTVYVSNPITVSGINAPASLSVSGGEYSINGGAYASSNTTVVNGDVVQVRGTSSGSNSTAINVALTIGGVSDVYTVTTQAAAGGDWTPAALGTDLLSWYDAKDAATITQAAGAVSQWSDKSGNSRHATEANGANQPAYNATGLNGQPALIAGTSKYLKVTSGIPYSGAAGYTTMGIAECNNSATYRELFSGFVGGTDPGGAGIRLNPSHGTELMRTNVALIQSGPTVSVGNHLLGIDAISGSSSIYIDGAGTTQSGTDPAFPKPIGMLLANIDGGFNFLGAAGELVFCKTLPALNRQKLEGYLAHKWGLQANLPAGHPYKTTPPTLSAWTPAALGTDLVGWYDAQDAATITQAASAVSQWNNKSTAPDKIGNATQATGSSQPAYNATAFGAGRAGLDFTSDSFSLGDLTSKGWTAGEAFYLMQHVNNDGSGPALALTAASLDDVEPYAVSDTAYIGTFSTTRQVIGTLGSVLDFAGSPRIMNARSGPGVWEYWKDGTRLFTTATNTVGLPSVARIGVSHLGAFSLLGKIGEVVVTKRLLTATERQQMEGYLAWKWGVAANLPAGHPYKTTPP